MTDADPPALPGGLFDANGDGAEWVSKWLVVTQPMIDRFAAATLDSDPMHDDPAWAAANASGGRTIAYGFQTMSYLSHLFKDALGAAAEVTSNAGGSSLNYGFDRLRLVSPVPAGSRIRGRFTRKAHAVDAKGRTTVTLAAVIEIEDEDRPALVADWLSVRVPAEMR